MNGRGEVNGAFYGAAELELYSCPTELNTEIMLADFEIVIVSRLDQALLSESIEPRFDGLGNGSREDPAGFCTGDSLGGHRKNRV